MIENMVNEIVIKEECKGYEVVVKRIGYSPFNYWYCGYVRIPEDHKFYGKDDDDLYDYIDVHGVLTFSGELDGEEGYFIGFDCNHSYDNPSVQDEEYTLNECYFMVEQLMEAEDENWNAWKENKRVRL